MTPGQPEPAFKVTKYGGVHSFTHEPYRWWQRPRWLWRALGVCRNA